MKKILLSMAPLFAITMAANAQNSSPYWSLAGNSNATSSSKLGTTNANSLHFYTNNVQRMIINSTSGLVGIGTTSPTDKLHINSSSGTNALRVQVNGSTKLLVHSGGGVSVGSSTTPPANGLYVAGRTGIGTATPENTLHVFKGSAGTVTGYVNAPLIVENSTHSFINMLAPDASETGILFGKPAGNTSGGIIYNSSSTLNGLQFRTNNNVIQMVLTDAGNVGIGTTNPGTYKLKVSYDDGGSNSGSPGGLDIENTSTAYAGVRGDWEIYTSPSNIGSNGELKFFYNGGLRAEIDAGSGQYYADSDERLKKNIKPMPALLDKINQLRPSTYQFKDDKRGQEYNGFIAQDVMKIFPDLVKHTVEPARKLDVYTMNYSGFGVLAIKGIQELAPLIERQQQKMDSLENVDNLKILNLENRINKLEAALAAITAKNGNITHAITNASLEQNNPNPFYKTTIIRYSIPQNSKGRINIYDAARKQIKSIVANESGQAELSAYSLKAGTYTYSLLVDRQIYIKADGDNKIKVSSHSSKEWLFYVVLSSHIKIMR